MAEYIPVAKTTDVPDPGKLLVEAGDRLIVIAQVGGQFYAIDDICTHDGGPLSEGTLHDCTIACPRHGARFDLATGAALTMPATSATVAHEVKGEGQQILVKPRDA